MRDLVLIVLTLVFFGATGLLVAGCDQIVGGCQRPRAQPRSGLASARAGPRRRSKVRLAYDDVGSSLDLNVVVLVRGAGDLGVRAVWPADLGFRQRLSAVAFQRFGSSCVTAVSRMPLVVASVGSSTALVDQWCAAPIATRS